MLVWIRLRRVVCALALLLTSIHGLAATSIVYQVFDLDDAVQNQDLWRYSYSVNGTFAPGYSFEILFDALKVASLESATVSPSTNDWGLSIIQPTPVIPSDGIFMAEATVANPSLAAPFEVTFVRKGLGVPDAQTFNVLNDVFLQIESGTTQLAPIPEPHTYLMFVVGLLVLLARVRRS